MEQPKNGLFMSDVHYSGSSHVNIPLAKNDTYFQWFKPGCKKISYM
jgi:hypothetical protein